MASYYIIYSRIRKCGAARLAISAQTHIRIHRIMQTKVIVLLSGMRGKFRMAVAAVFFGIARNMCKWKPPSTHWMCMRKRKNEMNSIRTACCSSAHVQTKQKHAGKSTAHSIWHQPCSNFSKTCTPIWRHHSLSAAATAGWLVEWTFSHRRKERSANLYLNLETYNVRSRPTLIRRIFSLKRCKVCDSDDSTSQRMFSDGIFYRHLKAKHSREASTLTKERPKHRAGRKSLNHEKKWTREEANKFSFINNKINTIMILRWIAENEWRRWWRCHQSELCVLCAGWLPFITRKFAKKH